MHRIAFLAYVILAITFIGCIRMQSREAAPPPPVCIADPQAHLLARAQKRIDRMPPGIPRPELVVDTANVPVDLDLKDEVVDLALRVPGLHGPHSILPGAWSFYHVQGACTTFVGEIDGQNFRMVLSDRHAGLIDLESTVNGNCANARFGVDHYRWQFDGAQYRIVARRQCECPDTNMCSGWQESRGIVR